MYYLLGLSSIEYKQITEDEDLKIICDLLTTFWDEFDYDGFRIDHDNRVIDRIRKEKYQLEYLLETIQERDQRSQLQLKMYQDMAHKMQSYGNPVSDELIEIDQASFPAKQKKKETGGIRSSKRANPCRSVGFH